jgi:hypothetical protein
MEKRYVKADKKEQGRLLDEMEKVTGMHRKSLIRRMNNGLVRKPRSTERRETYGREVDDALRIIDESANYICAERITSRLVWYAQHLDKHGELTATPELQEQLGQISVSTVARRLARVRQGQFIPPRRKRAKRTSSLFQSIPAGRIFWGIREPGHFEIDLVLHCGPSNSGEFMCSLQMLDMLTAWSERAAILGRSYAVVEDAYYRILGRLPFPILEAHPDNGSEFINHLSVHFWCDIMQGVSLSRSRPYQKNDNRMIEQKNSPLVRDFFGYDRLDTVEQVQLANRFYDKAWWHYNFFQPVLRLREKVAVRDENGQVVHIKRRHDEARTPFERLCETDAILPEHKELLERMRDQINPRQLRQELYDLIDQIFSLSGAVAGVTEDVFETLVFHPMSTMSEDEKANALNFSFNRTVIKKEDQDDDDDKPEC